MLFTRLVFVLSLVLTSCVSQDLQDRRQAARNAARRASETGDRAPYRIMPGDSLRIEHPFNEELNRVVVVRPDGFITLPLIQEMNVADRTIAEAKGLLESEYARTVRNAKLSLTLESAANVKICVGGEVINPGLFALSDGLTALRAIAMAGGPRPSARLSSVVILRDQGLPEPEYLLVDLRRTTVKLDGRDDIRLRQRDIVFVPRSPIANMNAFVDQYINQLIPFSKNLGVTYLIGNGVY
jgi:protein involved in polysaccharide export with SLBB domain